MKITNLRLRQLQGTMKHPDPFWEERLVRPVDVYPRFRAQGPSEYPKRVGRGRYSIDAIFLEVETDEGVTGLSNPISPVVAFYIDTQLRTILEGADPIANELLWDQMYRYAIHGRKGDNMMAISAVDIALWDIKGKWLGQPVCRLLGGPTRDELPTYASCLGYSLEPDKLRQRAQQFAKEGYRYEKWFFRYGPADGPEGVKKNVEMVRILREAVGEDVEIMLDAWSSWDVPYTIQMAQLIAEYHPYWIEEPVLADKPESYARLREVVYPSTLIRIAGGEHEYTRWGLKMLLEMGAADVYQPDLGWAGGITEMVKICALASAYDAVVIPHGGPVPVNIHLLLSQPPTTCPIQEYLFKWNEIGQFFYKEPVVPVNGIIKPPTKPGFGMELDESKIEEERKLSWSWATQRIR